MTVCHGCTTAGEDAVIRAQAVTAYIGLGSNLDGPLQQLQQAFVALQALPASRLRRRSACYRSTALTLPDTPAQPDYVNAVAEVETRLAPQTLLDALQRIEVAQGRRREGGVRWGGAQPRSRPAAVWGRTTAGDVSDGAAPGIVAA